MTSSARVWGAAGRVILLGLLVAWLGGCTDGAGAPDEPAGSGDTTILRVVIPDNNIREEGAACAGARPFQALRPGAPWSLSDDGEVVATGELPSGEAHDAEPDVDWGRERIPTLCVMDLEVGGLDERGAYELQLPARSARPVDPSLAEDGVLVVMVD
jgi:hypothetical protein